jgi:hypothetical protein
MGGALFMLAGGLTRNSQLLLETLNIGYTLLILLYCR